MRLLEKDADLRFASAQHLLFVLKAHKTNPEDKIFVGHTRSFSIIVEHIARLHDHHGGLIWVDGPTGSGITSFLKHIRQYAENQNFFASYNQGRTYKGSAYQGLRALFESLPEALQAQIYAPDPLSKWMLFAKIRDELVARGPSVIILDNIHLSDSGTIELMSYLIRNTLSERHAPILFLIGTHTDVDTTEIDGIFNRTVHQCRAHADLVESAQQSCS